MMCSIPPVIGTLTTLREINLCYNMLDSLPKEVRMRHKYVYIHRRGCSYLFFLPSSTCCEEEILTNW